MFLLFCFIFHFRSSFIWVFLSLYSVYCYHSICYAFWKKKLLVFTWFDYIRKKLFSLISFEVRFVNIIWFSLSYCVLFFSFLPFVCKKNVCFVFFFFLVFFSFTKKLMRLRFVMQYKKIFTSKHLSIYIYSKKCMCIFLGISLNNILNVSLVYEVRFACYML